MKRFAQIALASLTMVPCAFAAPSVPAGLVQDGSQISGTFLVQEQTSDCYYNTDTIDRSSGNPEAGLVTIHADESGASICNPVTDGDQCAEEMMVGTSSSSGVSGIHDVLQGAYTADGFFYSYSFYAYQTDTTPDTSVATSLVPDSSGNVLLTITSTDKSTTSTLTCHLTKVN